MSRIPLIFRSAATAANARSSSLHELDDGKIRATRFSESTETDMDDLVDGKNHCSDSAERARFEIDRSSTFFHLFGVDL